MRSPVLSREPIFTTIRWPVPPNGSPTQAVGTLFDLVRNMYGVPSGPSLRAKPW